MKTANYALMRILFALVVGLVLVMWPDAATKYLVITVGAAFLVPGVISLFGFFAIKRGEGRRSPRFPIEGVGSFLLGLWLILMPDFFAGVLMFLLGVILVLGGLQQLFTLMRARRWARVSWMFYIVPTLILIAGVVSLADPIEAKNTVLLIIGAGSLVYALSELVNWFKFIRNRPEPIVTLVSPDDVEDAQLIE